MTQHLGPSNISIIPTVYPLYQRLRSEPDPPPSICISGIVCNLDIIHLNIRPPIRTAQHDHEHVGIAHRPERRDHRVPHPNRGNITVHGHAARRGPVRILDLDRTLAEIRRVEFVIQRDGVIRSGAGVQRLLQGERADAVVREGRQEQRGIEGVSVAAGVGTAGRDDAVGTLADGIRHGPGREVTGFEAAVLNDGTTA